MHCTRCTTRYSPSQPPTTSTSQLASAGTPSVANSVAPTPKLQRGPTSTRGPVAGSGASVGSAAEEDEEDREPPPPPQLRELDPAPQALSAHAGPMTCMRLSRDGAMLFTGGADGSICMFNVVHDVGPSGGLRTRASPYLSGMLQSGADDPNRDNHANGAGYAGDDGNGENDLLFMPLQVWRMGAYLRV